MWKLSKIAEREKERERERKRRGERIRSSVFYESTKILAESLCSMKL